MNEKLELLSAFVTGSTIAAMAIGLPFKIHSINKGYKKGERCFKYKDMSLKTFNIKCEIEKSKTREIKKEILLSLIPIYNIYRGATNFSFRHVNDEKYSNKYINEFEDLNDFEVCMKENINVKDLKIDKVLVYKNKD